MKRRLPCHGTPVYNVSHLVFSDAPVAPRSRERRYLTIMVFADRLNTMQPFRFDSFASGDPRITGFTPG